MSSLPGIDVELHLGAWVTVGPWDCSRQIWVSHWLGNAYYFASRPANQTGCWKYGTVRALYTINGVEGGPWMYDTLGNLSVWHRSVGGAIPNIALWLQFTGAGGFAKWHH